MSLVLMEETLSSVLDAIATFEYLVAKKNYEKLLLMIEGEGVAGEKFRQCHLKKHDKLIKTMLHKCNEINLAFRVCEQEHEDWTVGSSAHGIITKYFIDEKGHINLKVEGELENLPLYEQLVVIWEVTLYHLWVPYCSDSRIIKSFDNSEFITTMTLNPPFGISRDIVVHAFGANCLTEQNSIVLVTKSLTNSDYDKDITKDVTIPPINKGFFSDRVDLHHLYCVNTMTSPSSTKFAAVLKLDPKLSMGLPSSILSWFINQLASVVFPLLRKQAIYLAEADPYNSSYTNQIRESSAFYVDFLLPMYRAYVQKQGWKQPVIRCLYEKGIPKDGSDYSLPLSGNDTHQKLKIRLPTNKAAQLIPKRKATKVITSGSPGGRSNSVISADFYSCLDDEEHTIDLTFSDDPSSMMEKYTNCENKQVLVGGEYEEPFLDEGLKVVDEKEKQNGSCFCSRKSCCMRLLCCCGVL